MLVEHGTDAQAVDEQLASALRDVARSVDATRAPDPGDVHVLDQLDARLSAISEVLQERLAGLPDGAAGTIASLTACTAARHELRERYTALQLAVAARTHASLARLRALPTVGELLPAAAQELVDSCGFERALVSSVHGSTWRAEAMWTGPGHDPELTRRIEQYLTGRSLPLGGGVLETELVRRRLPVLVRRDPDQDPPEQDGLMVVARSRGYVAAPVWAGRRVVGFLQADCGDRRGLTTFDRDALASFAEAFGLVFERTNLLDRLRQQRARAHDAFGAAERQLAGLDDTETVLVRGDKRSVAVFRTAAGLRRSEASPTEQLLTARERQVIELMVRGAANRRIADELVVTEETVKSHVRSISRKLRASSRADAVSRYLHLRLRER